MNIKTRKMMLIKNQGMKLSGLAAVCVLISACDRDFSNPVDENAHYHSGEADFSKFVTVGDSLTAGFADGALYLSGQKNSYPAILAKQFATVGGGEFTQPLMNDDLGGLLVDGATDTGFPKRLVLNAAPKNPPDDLTAKGPEPIAGDSTTEVKSVLTGTYNNMGVPGAKSFHLESTAYGNPEGLGLGANPYFVRFASGAGASVLGDVTVQQPSFFMLWIGSNDILSYATEGGVGIDRLNDSAFATYAANDITDPTVFKTAYDKLVEAMITNAATKGVLVNIPDIRTIPYFTAVPYNIVSLDQAAADTLNAAYAAYNGGIAALLAADPIELLKRTIVFSVGQNAVVIEDDDLTDLTGLPSMRQATADDLLVLTSSAKIGVLADSSNLGSAWGVGTPLLDGDVLIPSEVQLIEAARLAFNRTIKAAADANDNLLFVDAAAIVADLSTKGISYGTGFVNATYATGGAFSLDGVHPTARGYAVIANRIIEEINDGFKANIPFVNPGEYTTIFIK